MTATPHASLLQNLSPDQKRRLAARLLRERSGEAFRPYPLSHNQRALYVLHQLEPDSAAYHVSFPLRILDAVDADAMERACQALTDRHPMLRSRIFQVDGEPMQAVLPAMPVCFERLDLSGLSPERQRQEIEARYRRPFDMDAGPLARFHLITLGEREHVWLPLVHHIAIDGQSILIALQETAALYRQFAGGPAAALPLQPTGYDDFVQWQRHMLEGADGDRLWAFWQQRLQGPLPQLDLPTDAVRPAAAGQDGRTLNVMIEPALTAQLKETARRQGVTLFTLMLAAFQVLLHRHSGQDDILIGCPNGSRPGGDYNPVVGYFVNPIALRADLSGNPAFADFLQAQGRAVLDAFAHRDLPLAVLVEKLGQAPALQAAFNFLQLVNQKELENLFTPPLPGQPATPGDWGGLSALPYPIAQQEGQFDLVLDLFEGRGALFGTFKFNAALYQPETIARWWAHYLQLLQSIVADPAQPIGQLPLLAETERRTLLESWHENRRDYPREASIAQLFEEQAARRPQATALTLDDRSMSYAELDARANQLAGQLLEQGLPPEGRVAVFLERGFEWVVALLAILKAGGAYVPLAANYPAARLQRLLEDTDAGWLLTSEALRSRLPGHSARVLLLDCAPIDIAAAPAAPALAIAADRLAYIMHTSGSTGGPKGVLVTHRNVVRLVRQADHTQLDQDTVFLLFAALAFDASTLELWGPLLNGGRLVIAPPGLASSEEIGRQIERHGVNSLFLSTALFHQLAAEQPAWMAGLRQIIVGGDALSASSAARLLQGPSPARLVNGYGPTENTTFSTYYAMTPDAAQPLPTPIPIGRPIANSAAYIVDGYGNPAPIGIPGELLVGGDGVARGYLKRPDLDSARFADDPWSTQPGARLYRTGDRARWLPDGNIEFLGRLDRQVKIRGFRIELPEIEEALAAQPGVAECVVIARAAADGGKRLLAYFVAAAGAAPSARALRQALAARLPDYMLPSALTQLAALPLSAHGKVDLAALPDPEADGAPSGRREPATPAEEILCGLWAELLGLERVGPDDDFFELGGHSLLSMRLAARLRDAFGVEVPLARLFECATPARQAALLDGADPQAASAPIPARPDAAEDAPLTSEQARLWFLDRLEGPSALYNIPLAFELRGPLDAGALEAALNDLLARHEALRTVFVEQDGQARARCRPLPFQELAVISLEQREDELAARLRESALQPFDLSADCLMRARLFRLAPQRHVFLLAMHHIVSDGWSTTVFCQELQQAYAARLDGRAAPFAALPIGYADYARWQAGDQARPEQASHLAYWREQLQGAPALLDLPTDRPRPAIQRPEGASLDFALPATLHAQLSALARRRGATLFMVLHAAFACLLSRQSGSDDIVIGTPQANRHRTELHGMIGLFVDLLALRTRVDADMSFLDLLAQSRAAALQAYAHQQASFEQVIDALQLERNLSHAPLVQVLFQLENAPPAPLALQGLETQPLPLASESAKFDLTFTLVAGDNGLQGRVEYRSALFDAATIEALAGQFHCLLQSVAADPARPVGALSLLDPAQRGALLAWSDGAAGAPDIDAPSALQLQQRFEAHARATPDATALCLGDRRLSYRELDRHANRLARRLRERGIGADAAAENLVGLLAERSLEMVVGILGILKAGGCYVPLDPAYPAERRAFIAEDAALRTIVVGQAGLLPQLSDPLCAPVLIELDSPDALGAADDHAPAACGAGERLAYVIYTSGSTGQPKGVMVEHRQVVRLFDASRPWFDFGPQDAWTLFHSFAFDFSVWELWGALLHGGRLVLVPHDTSRDPALFLALLAEQRVTVLNQTPSAFRQLAAAEGQAGAAALPALRYVVFGGEAVDLPSVREWMGRHGDQRPLLVNMYGITETTVHVSSRPLTQADLAGASISPIGRPLADLQIHVLDSALQPVPAGVIGEMYIGGAGLARGYLNRPELTRERFLPDTLSARPGARLYKTGDLARWHADGELEYLGRSDNQVKIRGFRIELGEIEAALIEHPALQTALVKAYQAAPGDSRLAAYIVFKPGQEAPIDALREHLRQRLPSYMLPSAFMALEQLPLTPSGKIDRRALPEPGPLRPELGRPFAPPATDEQKLLAGIWSQVLKLDRIGIDDNFFELGGDSILSIEVLARAAQSGLRRSLQQLFQHQTVRELAAAAGPADAGRDAARYQAFSLLAPAGRERLSADLADAYPLAALQAGMIFHSEHDEEGVSYHDLLSLHLEALHDPAAMRAALDRLTERHPILRTSFALAGADQALQYVHRAASLPLVCEDWRHLDAAAQERNLAAWFAAEQRLRFDWSQAPLARLFMRRRGERSFELTLSVHHAVLDGWSAASFFSELLREYLALAAGQAAAAPALAAPPYADYIALEQAALADPACQAFWDAQLDGASLTRLPRSHGASAAHGLDRTAAVPIPPALSEQLKQQAKQAGVPLKSLLLAAHLYAQSLICGERDVITGLVSNGRPETGGAAQALGLFLNTIPLRHTLADASWHELARAVAKQEQALLPHRRYPLAEIQRRFGGELFETAFNFIHFHVLKDVFADAGIQVLQERGYARSNLPLAAEFTLDVNRGDCLTLRLSVNDPAIGDAQLARMAALYQRTLQAIAHDSHARPDARNILPPEEMLRVSAEFARGPQTPPPLLRVHERFAAQAALRPDAVALADDQSSLSYAQLERQANQLAHCLLAQDPGLGPDSLVAVALERGFSAVVAMLAVLKTGAAYLPMDMSYPAERLAYMLEDAKPRLVLSQSALLDRFPAPAAAVLCLDRMEEQLAGAETGAPAVSVDPGHLAYVIYTSGSTGRPKGVQIEHRGMSNMVDALCQAFNVRADDVVLQFAGLGFDASVAEIFTTLVPGAALVLAPPKELLAGAELAQRLRRHKISMVTLPPSTLSTLPDADFPDLHTLITAGEACSAALAERWAAGRRLVNAYGPSEAAVCASVADYPGGGAKPKIGRPIANAMILVLDAQGQPLPAGAAGEICIGGRGLARGYLGRPDLTAERFILSPLDGQTRLYRTGDRGRWGEDGQLEFLGRDDDQIKLRGFRIEPGEIEEALLRHPAIRECQVVPRRDAAGAPRLVACLSGHQGDDAPALPSLAQIREYLGRLLPDYMIPAAFEVRDALPRTANGKFDRRLLSQEPAPAAAAALARDAFQAPATATEIRLAAIWSEVLRVDAVGIHDNFFELGGDSILSIQLVSKARDAGLAFGTRALFEHPQIAALAAMLDAQADGKTAGGDEPSARTQAEPDPKLLAQLARRFPGYQDVYPLTPLQQGLLFESLRDEQRSGLYFEQQCLLLQGELDAGLLERAFAEVVQRHDALRAAALHQGLEAPLQLIRASQALPWRALDWRALDPAAFQAELEQLLADERAAGFDFEQDSLLRLCLLRRSERDWMLVVNNHHLLMDGWSFSIVLSEALAIYRSLLRQTPLALPPATPYRAYLDWLGSRERGAAERYWNGYLAQREASAGLSLPAASPAQAGHGQVKLSLDPAATQALQAMARRLGLTLNTLCLGAWSLLLARNSRQNDVLFGVTLSVRPPELPGSQGMVGLFINTVPARVLVDEDASLPSWLSTLQASQADSRDHAWLPLSEIRRQDPSAPARGWFDSLLIFENYPVDPSLAQGGDGMPSLAAAEVAERTQYPLTLLFQPGASLEIRLVHDLACLDAAAVRRLGGHLQCLLQAMAASPDACLRELDHLPAAERRQLLRDFNASDAPLPPYACLHHGFEAQVRRAPEAVALIDGLARLSYRQLDERANHLAWQLHARGVGPETLVCLLAPRGVDMVVGILAILKAGGAYLPLDPDYPAERIAYIVEHAGPALALVGQGVDGLLPAALPALPLASGGAEASAPPCAAGAGDLAYVLYTSGSTGKPKGVAVEHRSAAALMGFAGAAYRAEELAGVLFSTSICFDLSVFELFAPLWHGGCAILARHALQLAELPAAAEVSLINTVPSAMAGLLNLGDLPAGVLTVNLCGEALPHELARRLYRQAGAPRVLNLYGPTEDTVYSTWGSGDPASDLAPPIGRPLDNRRAYVLDAHMRPQPIGVPGELYLGGAGLARGYLHRPDLTAERFVDSPFEAAPGARLYRTGDLCRWRDDGQLEYIGRLDHQVKVRGHRIELGEIESALQAHPGVQHAAVLARADGPGAVRLVAYVLPRGEAGADSRALHAHLAASLPDYMLPASWVFLSDWPLTPNGKLDRKALPAPETEAADAAARAAPRNACEDILCSLWAAALKQPAVGIHDDFFALGGDSILAIQLVGKARQAGWTFSVRQLFEHPNVAALAAQLSGDGASQAAPRRAGAAEDAAPALTPIQQWFFEQRQPEVHHFNQALLLETLKPLPPALLERALRHLLQHHDALRQRYLPAADGGMRVDYAPSGGDAPICETLDLSQLDDAALANAIETAANAVQAGLGLENGPLLRALLIDLGPDRPGRLLLAAHHLAVDWVSWWIMLDDLSRALEQLRQDASPQLPAKTSSYRDWAAYLAGHAASPAIEAEFDFWRERLPVGVLPGERAGDRTRNTVASSFDVEASLSADDTRLLLQTVPELFRARVDDILIAALAQAHAAWSGQQVLQLDVESHGREEFDGALDLSRTVGWFTSLYPVQIAMPAAAASPSAWLKNVKEQLRRVPQRGVGYGLLRYLHPDPAVRAELAALPRSPYSFNYLGQSDQSLPSSGEFRYAGESVGNSHSPLRLRAYPVEINSFVTGGQLQCRFTYSRNLHEEADIAALAGHFVAALRGLLSDAASVRAGARTPSDYPLARLDQAQLDRVLDTAGHAADAADLYPLTPMQQGLLFHCLKQPGAGLYMVQQVLTLEGDLQPEALRDAWRSLLARHPILRTRFLWNQLEQPLQWVRGQAELPWRLLDWRGLDPQRQRDDLEALLRDDRAREFDLDQAPLLRVTLIRSAEHTWQAVWTNHHLLLDGWSTPILLRELFDILAGKPLAPAPRPFRDYAGWLQKQDPQACADYWRRELAGVDEATPLPLAPAAGQEASGDCVTLESRLSAEDSAMVTRFLRGNGLTWSTLARGAWALLLGAYSMRDDVVFGAVVAGRPAGLPGVESMVGMFVNTLPVRVRLPGDSQVLAWLQGIQAQQAEQSAFEHCALAEVQALSGVPGGEALFETLLVVENYPVDAALLDAERALRITGLQNRERADLPLSALLLPGAEPGLVLSYQPARYQAEEAARLLAHWQHRLLSLARQPAARLDQLDPLTPAERQRVLLDWNDTAAPALESACMHTLFERCAARFHDTPALRFQGAELSYGQLDARADQLARQLRARGIGAECRVGLLCERSLEMVVGLLAILKAGGAYLPLDPAYPAERLRYMVEDAGLALLLAQPALLGALPDSGVPVLALAMPEPLAAQPPLAAVAGPGNAAYLIYTSGSTGRPKGAVLQHGGVFNLAQAQLRAFAVGRGTRVLQFASLSFDASAWEILMALSAGGTLCLAPAQTLLPGLDLARLLREERIEIATLPPSALAAMPDSDFPALRTLIVAGEACPPELVDRWAPGRRFINAYGPTEATVCATLAECAPGEARTPIGKPLDNIRVYLLGPGMQAVPQGAVGELYIGGAGLARGYHQRPELDAERFVSDPFSKQPGHRLYRTGDLCRWRDDGQLDYLGRIDHQLKIRGHRIEAGEVETLLRRQDGVADAAVIGRAAGQAGMRLTAYVVPRIGAQPDIETLRRAVGDSLPAYMVPTDWALLEALPLTPNGKLDRKALPEPQRPQAAPAACRQHDNPAAALIADLFAAVLGLPRVGVDDSFFQLGGHSLLATQVQWRIREMFQAEMPLRVLFDAPTPRALAERVDALRREQDGAQSAALPALAPRAAGAHPCPPLSFGQERLYFLDRLEPDSAFYNSAFALRLDGGLDIPALRLSLRDILERHEVLRTAFRERDGQPYQAIAAAAEPALEQVDLSGLSGDQQQADLRLCLNQAAQQALDLANGPLARFSLFALGAQRHALLAVFHHAVFDGWSVGVFFRELAEGYQRHSGKDAPPPAPLPAQYADYAIWQRDWLDGPAQARELAWWQDRLAGLEPLQLPLDRPRPPLQSYRGDRVAVSLPPALVRDLEQLSRDQGATLFMTLLAAFKALLHRYSGQDDIVVGTPIAGRRLAQTENLIGCFINLLPLRTSLADEPDFNTLLARTRQTTLDAYSHQDIPFEKLVQKLAPARDPSRSPLFQTLFTLQNLPATAAGMDGIAVEPLALDNRHALYDLSLTLHETPQGIEGDLEFNTDLFDRATAARLAAHWLRLLEGAARDPACPVSRLPLLDDAERRQLLGLGEAGPAAADADASACLHRGFEEQAKRQPDAMAIDCRDGAQRWSYGQLNAGANRLARRLAALGVAPGDRVALCLPRAPQLIMSLLAILKAGAVYLPLDPATPRPRLETLLRDSGARVLIGSAALLQPGWPDIIGLDLDAQAEELARLPADDLRPDLDWARHPASLIYTSGSTGTPKGVLVPHGAMLNHASWAARCFAVRAGERLLQFASVSFDAAAEEIFPTLLSGATLVLRDDDALAPDRFGPWVQQQGIAVLNLPTAYWHAWVDWLSRSREALPSTLRLLVIGGERASRTRYAAWRALPGADAVRWLNTYGPTEATVSATVFDPARSPALHPEQELPIGKPLDGVRAYVLDAQRQPQPQGAPGELYLAGAGVALGYWQRDELNAAAFLADPFSADPAARMFKTGDLCRWRGDGQLEYLGRGDQQVKIRGFRIEPGEIEAALTRHAAVAAVAVLACAEAGQQSARLVACLVASPEREPDFDPRAYLRPLLPDYMIPSDFVWLPELPLTTSGKIDRNRLKALPQLAAPSAAAERPAQPSLPARDEIERGLAAIWAELLEVPEVGRRDDFFALGGHSLLALRSMALIRQRFGKSLPLSCMFQGATIEALAERLRGGEALPLAGGLALPPPEAARLQTLQSGDGSPAFFCVTPSASSALCYAALARHMGASRAFHALEAAPLPDHVRAADLPRIAAGYVAALRARQADGPYLLGGWSLGGLIAFEMARQLQAAGAEVAQLVLMDSVAPHARPNPYLRPQDRDELRRQLCAGLLPEDADQADLEARVNLYAAHLDAAAGYAPEPAAVAITLLRARDLPEPAEGQPLPDLLRDEALGWRRHALLPVAVQTVDGDHLTMLREPHVRQLAARLRERLDSALPHSSFNAS